LLRWPDRRCSTKSIRETLGFKLLRCPPFANGLILGQTGSHFAECSCLAFVLMLDGPALTLVEVS
jgi:hypothetical protein